MLDLVSSGPPRGALMPVPVLLTVFGTDLWVYLDVRTHTKRGALVIFSASSFEVSTPDAWLFGCLLLWIVFFPLYLTSWSRR